MYSLKNKRWLAECSDEKQLEIYRENQKTSTEAQYYIADNLLAKGAHGKETANAVWMMENAANEGYSKAMLAMGEMFEFGWAVNKNKQTALQWYEKALDAGCEDAAVAIARLSAKKKSNVILGIIGALLAVALILAAILFVPSLLRGKEELPTDKTEETKEKKDEEKAPIVVKVGDDTELKKNETAIENARELNELVGEYDTEEMIKGNIPTARVLVGIKGGTLDLTDFDAVEVLQYDFGETVIIQFKTVEEAQECVEELKKRENVLYATLDTYSPMASAQKTENIRSVEDAVTTSSYSGYDYMSWGIEDMELDIFADYLAKNVDDTSVLVAVVDSGATPNKYTEDRWLEGANFCASSYSSGITVIGPDINDNGQPDAIGHGTHVASTIWDATQGLDVTILPVGVLTLWQDPYGEVHDSGLQAWIALGIHYAREQGADVINMSLGGCMYYEDNGVVYEKDYSAEEAAIDLAIEDGILVVVSAGNEADDAVYYRPAGYEPCITVAAYDSDNDPTSFTNYGEVVDVIAPGMGILSYNSPLCTTSIMIEDDVYVETLPGTSMASPHVAALAAMLKAYIPDITQSQAEQCIKDYCEVIVSERLYGAGKVHASEFIEE